jgi:hypothetical protein
MQGRKIDQLPKMEHDHVLSIRAVVRGVATPAQQRTAMREILRQLCGVTTIEPARMTEREAGFMAGQRWVGMAINAISGTALYTVQDVDPEYGWDQAEMAPEE